MEITNKTLGMLLIAAIVVSLGGTFVSLNKLDGVSTTGYATNNETGTVTLAVGSALSIDVVTGQDVISFGTCTPDTVSDLTLDSAQASSGVNNSNCDGTFPDNITIENDGNVDANVTVRATVNGTSLFAPSSVNSALGYKANNIAGDAGCAGTLQTSYVDFTIEDDLGPGSTDENPVCDNLTFTDANDRIAVSARIVMPANTVSTVGSSTVTFEASISGA